MTVLRAPSLIAFLSLSPWSPGTMDPVAEDVQGPDDISKESLKPAPDPETIVLRKNRNKDSKKEQRR